MTVARPTEAQPSVQSANVEHNQPGDEAPRDPDDNLPGQFNLPPEPSPQNWWDNFGDSDHDPVSDPMAATAPLRLPPDDRLWRHPSELNTADPPESMSTALADATTRRAIVTTTVSAAFAGALVAGVAILFLGPGRELVTERVVERQLIEPSASFVNVSLGGLDVVTIAEAVKPSIVRVEILSELGGIVGSGSGVIFRDDGNILTNAHVVEGAADIEVVAADGRRYEAELIGADTLTDIAVVKIEGDEPFPTILLGSTSRLRVGEPAVAVGSPLRLTGGPTVTVGVVSAIGRTLDLPSGGRLFDLVQTDAPISPGSSGGALVDSAGALIGITTVIAVSDVGAEGLGFATPVEIAHDIAVELVADGEVAHGFLGVSGDDLSFDRAAESRVEGGAVITAVGQDTPADAAGFEVGDVVLAIDNVPVLSMSDLVVRIRRINPGGPAEIEVLRGTDRLMLTALISPREQ